MTISYLFCCLTTETENYVNQNNREQPNLAVLQHAVGLTRAGVCPTPYQRFSMMHSFIVCQQKGGQ